MQCMQVLINAKDETLTELNVKWAPEHAQYVHTLLDFSKRLPSPGKSYRGKPNRFFLISADYDQI